MDFHIRSFPSNTSIDSLFPPPNSTSFDSPSAEFTDTVLDTHTPQPIHDPTIQPLDYDLLPTVPDQIHFPDLPLALPPEPHATRHSTRSHNIPAYLQDYHCQLASANPMPLPTTPFPL